VRALALPHPRLLRQAVRAHLLICEALLNFNLHVFQESYTRHRSNRYLLRF
jgi:hypothetical protein